eukprot:TRINITY_DN12037_c0_g1_i1.p1 TRINITY_DN12037_c0_g1~~TRINITY_DN12037_c0_g1_i1.p1  ORF type:complete len:132 (-),score=28.84 TRINITY_DN12037_c0_g1_i1:65-460(-)
MLCGVFFFFFKQKTAYEIMPSLVGSEMCIRDRSQTQEIKKKQTIYFLIKQPQSNKYTSIKMDTSLYQKDPDQKEDKSFLSTPAKQSVYKNDSSYYLSQSVMLNQSKPDPESIKTQNTYCLLYTSPSPRDQA